MGNWKIIAGFAGFAIVLSILTGAIGGVGGGDIFLRALVWGILFAGLGFGISVVIEKMLPGLGGGSIDETPADPSMGEEGGEIDIMLPSENPHYEGGDDEYVDEFSVESEGGEMASEPVQNRRPRVSKGSDSEEEFGGEEPRELSNEDLETLEDIAQNDSSIGGDDLDTLPDLDRFAGSFSNFNDMGSGGGEDTMFKSSPKDAVDIAGATEDPAKVAKAIHTWMERDKEG